MVWKIITLKSMCQQLEWHMEKNADYIHNQYGRKKSSESYFCCIFMPQ